MKVNIYSQEGKEIGKTLLPKEIFDLKINPDLVHQVVVSEMQIILIYFYARKYYWKS